MRLYKFQFQNVNIFSWSGIWKTISIFCWRPWKSVTGNISGGEYYIQSERAMEAMETLDKTFSREQRELFQDYEEKQNAADDMRGRALTRQIFLLAKEIYR